MQRQTLSDYLRTRALPTPAAGPKRYRVKRDPLTGLPVTVPPAAVPKVSSEQVHALLADFP